jgi:hypothetical protein
MTQEVYQDYEPDYVKNEQDYLHDWVFHYNSINEQWAAIPRDKYAEYWNDYSTSYVLRSNSINTLLDLLHLCKGDITQLNELLKY